ncbi:GIY-YIG nuclease family protein [Streptomyces sp. NPDC054865]
MVGSYVLYTSMGLPRYVGRSDTDIRRRLLRHCTDQRGAYFTYDVHNNAVSAFDMECALFHALSPQLTNRIHPDRPDFHETACVFCRPETQAARQFRDLQQTSAPAPRA